jgi:hypothetical protein
VYGAGDTPAGHVTYALGIVALAGALRFVRDDRRSLVALLGVSLLATPILWPHYLVLLFVPVALTSPTFTRVWLVPVALWADTKAWSEGSAWRVAGELGIAAIAVAAGLTRASEPSKEPQPSVHLNVVTTNYIGEL